MLLLFGSIKKLPQRKKCLGTIINHSTTEKIDRLFLQKLLKKANYNIFAPQICFINSYGNRQANNRKVFC